MNKGTTTISQLRQLIARITRMSPSTDASEPAPKAVTWSAQLIARMDWMVLERVVAQLFNAEQCRAETMASPTPSPLPEGGPTRDVTSVVFARSGNAGMTSDGKHVPTLWFGVFTHRGVRRGLFMTVTDASAAMPNSLNAEQLLQRLQALPPERSEALLRMATQGDWSTPTCPTCHAKTLKLKGGAHYFWGCKNFPKCPQSFDLA